jgi:hypothetical protein
MDREAREVMAEPGVVDITLPTGQAATVPEADLGRALAAGAKVSGAPQEFAPGSDEAFLHSGLGQGITGVLGAGRALTGGATDFALSEGFGLIGGEGARKDSLKAFQQAKEANPYSDLAGELGGLYLGGGGITAAGEAAEAAAVEKAGASFAGKAFAGGIRGGTEAAMLGKQHSITEDQLGDHAINGEKMFQTMGKEALLGFGVGTAIGAAGHGLGLVFGKGAPDAAQRGLEHGVEGSGSVTKAGLDELAGAKGAGAEVRKGLQASEETIDALRRTGLTGEQAAEMADQVAQAAHQGPPKSFLEKLVGGVDWMSEQYAKIGGSPERAAILKHGYDLQAGLREGTEDVLRTKSSNIAKKLTSVFRDLEDTANELQFAEKPAMMRKLIDPSLTNSARDSAARMFQEVKATVDELGTLASKGGSEGALKKVANGMKDLEKVFAKEGAEAGEFFIATDKLKRLVGKFAKHEIQYGKTEAEQAFTDVYQSLRRGLEDEASFGLGGRAQKELNASFAETFGRRNHALQTVGQTIDRSDLGVKLAGGDFGKIQGMMRSLTGDATDAELEGVKSIEAFIDGTRRRVGIVEKYADLTAEQAAKITQGKAALEEFAQDFSKAREEIAAANRLRSVQLLEREGRSVGGLVGMIGDVITKPLSTMERLAEVRSSVVRMDKTIDAGMKKAMQFRGGAASKAENVARATAEKEILAARELGNNPTAMADRAHSMAAPLLRTAPKIAQEVAATAMRAMTFLAKEAPVPLASRAVFGTETKKPRFSDQQLAAWRTKREAALGTIDGKTAPEVIARDLEKGRLNRDAIRTIEFVSPKLFAQIQVSAQKQIEQMAADGRLDKLTMAQQGAIASLLKVPPGEIWKPDFMLMMQSAQSYTQFAEQNRASASPTFGGVSKRTVQMNTDIYSTGAQNIESRLGGTS